MSKTKVNPKWFRHKALHTSYVLLSMVNDHLTRHQYYLERINPEFNRHIDAAIEHLTAAYQAAGNEGLEVKKKIKV